MKSSLILIPKSTLNEKKRKVICFKKNIPNFLFFPFYHHRFHEEEQKGLSHGSVSYVLHLCKTLLFFCSPLFYHTKLTTELDSGKKKCLFSATFQQFTFRAPNALFMAALQHQLLVIFLNCLWILLQFLIRIYSSLGNLLKPSFFLHLIPQR